MNSLSWLIYLADVLPSFAAITVIMAVGTVALAVIGAINVSDQSVVYGSDSEKEAERKRSLWPAYTKKLRRYCWIPLVLISFSVVSPSKTTIYMIAASETGEMVVQSDEAKELLSDVHKLIKQRIAKELGQ